MDVSNQVSPQKPEAGFLDRLGGRFLVKGRSGEHVEILIFRDELVSASGFEAAVRGAVARLADFRHPAVRRVRGVARLAEPDNRLALVSDSSPGSRLSDVLLSAEREHRPIDTRAALHIVRELLTALRALHEASGGVCHGALGPERIVVAPDGRVLVVEHVLGSALECHTAVSQERFWRDYRLAIVEEEESPRFGPRTDVLQSGLLALSLVLGRMLRRDEFPRQIGELLLGATESGHGGVRTSLGLGLRAWLVRALQLGSQDSFATVGQALAGLEQILTEIYGYMTDSGAVAAMLAPVPAAPAAVTPARPAEPELHEVSEAAETARADELRPTPASITPPSRSGGSRLTGMGVAAQPLTPVAAEASSATPSSPPVQATVSVDSLTTPAGVDCIAAEVRQAPDQTPKSGTPRAVGRAAGQPKMEPARIATTDVRRVDIPETSAPMLFGGDQQAELLGAANAKRRWAVIGAAAAGLILVAAGIPGVWLWSRPTPPPPQPAHAAEVQPADSTTPPAKSAPQPAASGRSEGRAAGSTEPGPGAPASARGDAAGGAKPAAAKQPAANAPGAPPVAAPPAAVLGQFTVSAPLPMQVFEKGNQVGASPGSPIPLPAGRHDLEFVNDSIGYRDTRAIVIAAGKTVPVVVNFPPGTVSINAIPWAEVFVDGQRVGETPVGNFEVAVGTHEVVFRHPQFGERRQTVVVTMKEPLRVSMDMRKQ
jgi:hypothetical protein